LAQRKQLKLSIDNSESSFNNITLKSADKHNSLVRGLASTKNASMQGGAKDLSA
jgi:hypothetical protein